MLNYTYNTITNLGHPIHSQCLTIDNLNDVMVSAWEARVEWYNIGLDLLISPDDLDTINADHRDTNSRYREMLEVWLRTKLHPSWKKLAKALRSPIVGYEDLAENVASCLCYTV